MAFEDFVSQYFPADAIDKAMRIMNAESSGNPSAFNVNKNKTRDSGLFQINDVNIPLLQKAGIISTAGELFNPETNIKAAAYLHSLYGDKPWTSSKSKWDKQAPTTQIDFQPEDQGTTSQASGVSIDFQPETTETQPLPQTTESKVQFQDTPLTWKDAISQGIGNIPKSAMTQVSNIVNALSHPVQTSKSIMALNPLLDPTFLLHPSDSYKAYKGLYDTYANRYGGLQNIKNTIASDPVGTALDVSSLASAAAVPLAETKAGSILSGIGKATDPINYLTAPVSAAKKLLSMAVPQTPASMYARALKPSTTLSDIAREKIINTALNEGIPVSAKGLEKSKGIIAQLNDEIQSRINNYAQEGATVDRANATLGLDELAAKELQKNITPGENISTIKNLQDEIYKGQPKDIPIDQAQTFKQTINKELNNFYSNVASGKVAPPEAWAKAKATVADALREEISNVFPEVTGLNQREGALIALNKSLNRAVNRISNRNFLSLLKGVFASGGGAIAGPKGAAAGLLAETITNNPVLQSNLAISLYKARQMPWANIAKDRLATKLMLQQGRVLPSQTWDENQQGGE